jgi:hypothetical protein
MLFSAGSRYKSLLRFVPTFILLIVPEAVKNADMFLLISKIILDFLATFSIWQGTPCFPCLQGGTFSLLSQRSILSE